MAQAQVKTRVGRDLTEGNILKLLLSFAGPIILTNLIQQLYSMVDLMVVGHFVGSIGTVGVSTGGELSDLMTPLATAFATAGQIYIAQLAGAKDRIHIREATGTLITLMMGLSFIFMAGTIVLYVPILNALNCPEEAFGQAASYMIVTALGMPFIFGYNAVCAMLRGMGESKRPLFFIIVAAVINIVFDLIFVVWFRLDALGTAIATVGSQIGAFVASFLYMYHRREAFGFNLTWDYFRIRKHPLRIILRLGIPQLVRVFFVQSAMLWVKSSINAYGMVASATYSVGNKIEKFMNVFVSGVDSAAGGMVGQNIGARKYDRVRKILYTALECTLVIASIVALLFLLMPKFLYGIFTSDTAVIDAGVTFMRIMCVAAFAMAYAGVFKSLATGAGAASLCLLIGILDGVCRVMVCLCFLYVFGQKDVTSYYWGAALCQLVPGFICMCYFFSGKWKTRKLLSDS